MLQSRRLNNRINKIQERAIRIVYNDNLFFIERWVCHNTLINIQTLAVELPCLALPWPCLAWPCLAWPCLALPCLAWPCLAWPYRGLTLPWFTVIGSRTTLPYLTLPYLTYRHWQSNYLTLPYLTLTYRHWQSNYIYKVINDLAPDIMVGVFAKKETLKYFTKFPFQSRNVHTVSYVHTVLYVLSLICTQSHMARTPYLS